MSIRALFSFAVPKIRTTHRRSKVLCWLFCLIVALAFGAGRAFAGAGSSGGSCTNSNTVDFGVASVATQVNGFINNTVAQCQANPTACDAYTYEAVVSVGPYLDTVINGFTVAYILSQDLTQFDGGVAFNLPDFGSSGTALTSTPSLDASNNFVPATFTIDTLSTPSTKSRDSASGILSDLVFRSLPLIRSKEFSTAYPERGR